MFSGILPYTSAKTIDNSLKQVCYQEPWESTLSGWSRVLGATEYARGELRQSGCVWAQLSAFIFDLVLCV